MTGKIAQHPTIAHNFCVPKNVKATKKDEKYKEMSALHNILNLSTLRINAQSKTSGWTTPNMKHKENLTIQIPSFPPSFKIVFSKV